MNKLAEEFGFVLTNNEFVPTDLFVRWTSGIYPDDNPFHRAKHMRTILAGCIEKGVRPSVVVSKSKGYAIYTNNVNEDTEDTEDTDETRDALRAKQQRIDELENEVVELDKEIRELKGGHTRSAPDACRDLDGMQFDLTAEIQRRIDAIDNEVNVTVEDAHKFIGSLVAEHGLADDVMDEIRGEMKVSTPSQVFYGRNVTTRECARIGNAMLNMLNQPIAKHKTVSVSGRAKEFLDRASSKRARVTDDASSSVTAQNNITLK